jgi:hypothetical protein
MLKKLMKVLLSYSMLDTEIGYVQGMNYIVGALLIHTDEVEAFHLFKYLMEQRGLRDAFDQGKKGGISHVQILERIVSKRMPLLAQRLVEFGIMYEMFAFTWAITLFTETLPV